MLAQKILKPLAENRVIGKRAVDPGQIKNDGPEVVKELFKLINLVAESMISIPCQIEEVG